MGLLKKVLTKLLIATLVLIPLFSSSVVYAGYTSWDQVPAENKEYAKEFFLSLREEGLSVEVATAMTARANSESGFDPFMLEGGKSGWEYRNEAPTVDSPPAFGFLQMQDRSQGGRLGKMIAFVESFDGGKGTTDKKVSARAQAKYAVEEFKSYDAFSVFPVVAQGGSAVVTTTGVTYPIDLTQYGYKEPIDSWEKFKNLKDSRLATLVWTMSIVRPDGGAYAKSYQNDFAMLDPIAKEFGGLSAGSGNSSETTVDASQVAGDDSLPDQWDLVGLTKRKYLYESQTSISLPDSGSLTDSQRYNVTSIKESVDSTKEFSTINVLRTAVAFIGIWFFVWGISLIIAYLFDRNNVYLEVSLVSLLTGGTITVLALDEYDVRKVNSAKVFRRVLLAFIVGFIIVSGTVYIGLSNTIYWLNDIISSL